MLISAILKTKGPTVVSVTGDTPLVEVTKTLKAHRIGAVLVREDDGAIDGVLSERDIVRGIADHGPKVLEREARHLMTEKVITCRVSDDVQAAMEIMTHNRIRHLPVMDGDKLVGLISIGDLVNSRIRETEQEAEALKEYIATG